MKPFTTELEIKFTKNPSWKVPSKVKMHPIKKLAICAKNGDDTPLLLIKMSMYKSICKLKILNVSFVSSFLQSLDYLAIPQAGE